VIPLFGDALDDQPTRPQAGAGPDVCRRCHRPLTDPVSLGFHIGPDCRRHLGIMPSRRRLVRLTRVRVCVPGPGQGDLLDQDQDLIDGGD
jgi:hypothetical protein